MDTKTIAILQTTNNDMRGPQERKFGPDNFGFKRQAVQVEGDPSDRSSNILELSFRISSDCLLGPQTETEVRKAVTLLAQIRSKETLTEHRVDKMKKEQLRLELKKRGLKTPREAVEKKVDQQNQTGKRKRIGLPDHILLLKNWIKNEKSRQETANQMMRARISLRIDQFREANGNFGDVDGSKAPPHTKTVALWNPYDYLERRRNSTIEHDVLFARASELLNNVSKSFEKCSAQEVERMIVGYEQKQPKYARYERELEDHDEIVAQLNRRKIEFHQSGVCNFHYRSFPVSNVSICHSVAKCGKCRNVDMKFPVLQKCGRYVHYHLYSISAI